MVQPVSAAVTSACSWTRSGSGPSVSAVTVTGRARPGSYGAANSTPTSISVVSPGGIPPARAGAGVVTPAPSIRTLTSASARAGPGLPVTTVTRMTWSGRWAEPVNRSVDATPVIRMPSMFARGPGHRPERQPPFSGPRPSGTCLVRGTGTPELFGRSVPIIGRILSTGLAERDVSRLSFRNMSSEDVPAAVPDGTAVPGPIEPGTDPSDRRLVVDDPKVMRALAHPLRWSILEALLHAGTLTATQAGEILGETPANCAFHLRTLARYGLVEEAGGGKGRERPWRRVITTFTLHTDQRDDPHAAAAVGVLDDFWTQRNLDRARASLAAKHAWPDDLRTKLVSSTGIRYLTPDEASELSEELSQV